MKYVGKPMFVVVSILLVISFPVHAFLGLGGGGFGGIVHDPTNGARLVQQLAEAAKQLTEIRRTADQATALFNSVKGPRDLGSLLEAGVKMGDYAYDTLPPEQQSALDQIHQVAGKYSEVYAEINRIKASAYQLTNETYKSMTPAQRKSWEQRMNEIARGRGMSQVAFNQAVERDDRMRSMRGMIGKTTDLKELGQVQAEIAADHAALINYQLKVDALRAIREEEQRAHEQEQIGRIRDQGHRPWSGKIEFPK